MLLVNYSVFWQAFACSSVLSPRLQQCIRGFCFINTCMKQLFAECYSRLLIVLYCSLIPLLVIMTLILLF